MDEYPLGPTQLYAYGAVPPDTERFILASLKLWQLILVTLALSLISSGSNTLKLVLTDGQLLLSLTTTE